MAESTAPEHALGVLVSRIATALRTEIEHDLAEFGVTANQWPILLLVHRSRASRPSEMAELIGIDRGAVTRLIDRLQEKGLLRRLDDPEDLRAARIELTERGRALVPVLNTIVSARNAATLAHLDPADREPLMRMLIRLDRALATAARPTDDQGDTR